MLKKTIKYLDYNNNEREEDFYFNLSEAELTEWELSNPGGLRAHIEKITKEQDSAKLIILFKELIHKAYGIKSEDGKRFIKNDDIKAAFEETEAYSNLFMELAFEAKSAVAFVDGIMPAKFRKKIDEESIKGLNEEAITAIKEYNENK
jgi:hypothetical protein